MNEKSIEVLIEENRKLKELLIKAVGDLEGLAGNLREEGNYFPYLCSLCIHCGKNLECSLSNTKSDCFSWESIYEYCDALGMIHEDLPF